MASIKHQPLQQTNNNDETKKDEYKWDIYWPNVIALTLIHLGAVYGFFLRSEILVASEIFMKVFSVFSGFGTTAGAHRLWSHKSYKATTAGQIFLMFLASSTYQNSVYIWCRDHRMHHKYTETDADPHNAKRGFFFSHMGWLMVRKHKAVKDKKRTVDLSDLEANPIVMFQHRYYFLFVIFCTGIIPTFIPWYFFGESLKVAFFRVTLCRYVLLVNLTWCINSFAHLCGNKPYNRNINPTECNVVRYILMGEQFHNYHHTFPWDYKTAEFSDDTRNLTTLFIDFLAWLGIVYDRRTTSKEMIDARIERTGDGSCSTNETLFRTYLSNGVDKIAKNMFNLIVFALFMYIT